MEPLRLRFPVWLILLVSTFLSATATKESVGADDDFPTELNSNVEEPSIALPEREAGRNFKFASRTTRKSSDDKLVQLCQEAVDTTSRRMLSTDKHTPWQIMHALLGLRDEFQILHNGEPISGLDWVAAGQVFDNEHWFEQTTYGGRAHPYSRPYAFEGHANQFVAILSMCGVGLDQNFGTANQPVTMKGMIRNAQMTINTSDEPTWTLWALSRYLPSDASWTNRYGESWSIEKLVQIQTAKPMRGAACGGTHGLFALAHARNVYLRQGKPLRGVWLQAEYKIRQYINTARMQQNSNGSLSSNFFRGREYDPDFNKRMSSAGHVLEFLMIALPQKELSQRWVRRAIEATARDLLDNRKAYVKCSPLYHSVNALNIYLDRVNPKIPVDNLVKQPQDTRTAEAPASDTKSGLKAVPISRPRTLNEPNSQSSEPATSNAPDEPNAKTREPLNDAESEVPGEVTTAAQPETKDKSKSVTTDESDSPTQWKATPPERRARIQGKDIAEKSENSETSTNQQQNDSNIDLEPVPELPQEKSSVPEAEPTPAKENALKVVPEPEPQKQEALGEPSKTPSEKKNQKPEEATEGGKPAEEQRETPAANKKVEGESLGGASTPADVKPTEDDSAKPIEPKGDGSLETPQTEVPVGINQQFLQQNLDLAAWVRQFESEAREIVTARDSILRAVDARPGMAIADVGAGTGLFVGLLSDQVGPDGAVYAVEISPRFVDFLDRRAANEGRTNVVVVRNSEKSLMMGRTKVDRVLICDTYHHFEYPAEMLKSVSDTLRPGGELILVDYERLPGISRPWVLNHIRAGKRTFRDEVTKAGFQFVDEVPIPEFEENYLLRFRKPAEN